MVGHGPQQWSRLLARIGTGGPGKCPTHASIRDGPTTHNQLLDGLASFQPAFRPLAARKGSLDLNDDEEDAMPKVDPQSGEPISDEPEQASDDLRGGKVEGDPALEGASETGGANLAEEKE